RAADPPPSAPRALWGVFGVAAAGAVAAGALGVWGAMHAPVVTRDGAGKTARVAPAPRPPARPFEPRGAHRVTFEEGCEEFRWWTPDGRTVVYDGVNGADTHVFALDVQSGARQEITHAAGWQLAPSVSPDGKTIAYLQMSREGQGTYVVGIDGSSPRRLSESA